MKYKKLNFSSARLIDIIGLFYLVQIYISSIWSKSWHKGRFKFYKSNKILTSLLTWSNNHSLAELAFVRVSCVVKVWKTISKLHQKYPLTRYQHHGCRLQRTERNQTIFIWANATTHLNIILNNLIFITPNNNFLLHNLTEVFKKKFFYLSSFQYNLSFFIYVLSIFNKKITIEKEKVISPQNPQKWVTYQHNITYDEVCIYGHIWFAKKLLFCYDTRESFLCLHFTVKPALQ